MQWTSFAIAPPTEIIWVPGVTGSMNPFLTRNLCRFLRITPEPQVTSAFSASNEMKLSR